MQKKVTEFNAKLHSIFSSSLENFDDVGTCISALMVQYGVKYKQPHQLDAEQEHICNSRYCWDTEAYFLDEINNEAHNDFKRFDTSCQEFLDYSGAIWKDTVKVRTRVVTADDDTDKANAWLRERSISDAANALAVLKIFEPLNFKN